MKEVTIIVPIYNVEKYLRDCFESLLKQTSDSFEVLAVNDGSKDGCKAIIDEYTEKYPKKIRAIHKENGGYGSVLQLAIQECDTPYFLVCDPDDTLEPNAVEVLLNLAKVSKADLTVGAKTFVYENSTARDYDPAVNTEFAELKTNRVYRKGTEEFDNLFFIDPSPHAKLYKRNLSTSIRFPQKVGYTDNLLFYMNLLQADSVIYTDEALANYLINRTGNSMQDVRYAAMNGEIDVFKTIIDQAEEKKDVPDIFWYRMFESFKFMLYKTRRMNCTSEQYKETLDHLETFLLKLVPYGEQILPYYRHYAKTKAVERLSDELLMRERTERAAFARIKRKISKAFVPAQAQN
ncbi:MAG: glycosyltransferase family 2 protein [Solobacterium sp.]|nr:glycosyltransferase family 2 protein [Solobacterium sp.]